MYPTSLDVNNKGFFLSISWPLTKLIDFFGELTRAMCMYSYGKVLLLASSNKSTRQGLEKTYIL